jgi:hypothetical protein
MSKVISFFRGFVAKDMVMTYNPLDLDEEVYPVLPTVMSREVPKDSVDGFSVYYGCDCKLFSYCVSSQRFPFGK